MTLGHDDLVRAMDGRDASSPEACPATGVLVAAAEGGADPYVRRDVADHVILCRTCAEELRLLLELQPWASAQAHLVTDPAAEQEARRPVRSRAIAWAYAAAAVLAVTAVALGVQVVRLKRQLGDLPRATEPARPSPAFDERVADQARTIADLEARLRAADVPDLNPPIIDLEPADASRSATRSSLPAIPTGARQIVLILNTTRRGTSGPFEVDIVDRSKQVLWTGTGLKQSADGTLTLVVPRAFAGPGVRIRLYSRVDGTRALVEEYGLASS